jgi:hypothetical protein
MVAAHATPSVLWFDSGEGPIFTCEDSTWTPLSGLEFAIATSNSSVDGLLPA